MATDLTVCGAIIDAKDGDSRISTAFISPDELVADIGSKLLSAATSLKEKGEGTRYKVVLHKLDTPMTTSEWDETQSRGAPSPCGDSPLDDGKKISFYLDEQYLRCNVSRLLLVGVKTIIKYDFEKLHKGVGPLTDGSHLTVDLNLRAKSLHKDNQRYISKAQFKVPSYNTWGRLDDQAKQNRIFETNEFGETKPHLQYLKRIEELLNTTPDLPDNFELPDPFRDTPTNPFNFTPTQSDNPLKKPEKYEKREMTREELAHRIARATMRSTPVPESNPFEKFFDFVWGSPVFYDLHRRIDAPELKYTCNCTSIPFIAVISHEEKLEYYSYRPRSDASFLIHRLPFVLVEVESNDDHRDEVRMLIQAACVVRLANEWTEAPANGNLNPDPDHNFVAMAIYVEKPKGGLEGRQIQVRRYLIYQPKKEEMDVYYSCRRFLLGDVRSVPEDASGEIGFLTELYNLHVLFNRNRKLSNSFSKACDFWELVHKDLGLRGFTSRDKKRSGGGPNNPGPNKKVRGSGPQAGSSSRKDADLADLNCEAMEGSADMQDSSDFEVGESEDLVDLDANSEWTKIKTNPDISYFYGNDFGYVVVKRVKRAEAEIHKHLAELADSISNRTIPLLHTFHEDSYFLLVMPVMETLDSFVRAGSKTSLWQQFLDGVKFMHQNLVAHLDLKPDNLVVGVGDGIRIIDYGSSVKVSGFWDEMVVGPVGTCNWVAPEVGPEKRFNPVAADLWSAGKILSKYSRDSDDRQWMEENSAKLMSHEVATRLSVYARLPGFNKRKASNGAEFTRKAQILRSPGVCVH